MKYRIGTRQNTYEVNEAELTDFIELLFRTYEPPLLIARESSWSALSDTPFQTITHPYTSR